MDMTAELAVKPPSYEEWLEMQWADDGWWDWLLQSECEYSSNDLGIAIEPREIYFDLYHNQCAGNGYIEDYPKFVNAHYDQLAKVSFVYTEMLRDDMIKFKWTVTRNDNLTVREYDTTDYWNDDFEFTQGFFKGMQVSPLYTAEPDATNEAFEEELLDIIKDYFHNILRALQSEDEVRTSTEEYEEWIKNCWNQ
jgi:hypothetical protein